MKIDRIKININEERTILIGCIVSNELLSNLKIHYKPDYIQSDYIRLILGWCFDHHAEHESAPGVHIKDIYKQYKRKNDVDESTASNIANILKQASRELQDRGKRYQISYLTKISINYFRSRSLAIVQEQAAALTDAGQIEEAENILSNHELIQIESPNDISILNPGNSIIVHEESQQPLFRLPGKLGNFINSEFLPGNFLGIMGQEKAGKTWNVMELCWQALKERNHVAFFQAGDMSQEQQLIRIACRIAKGFNCISPDDAGRFIYPVLDCLHNQNDTCEKEKRLCNHGIDDHLDWIDAHKMQSELDFYKHLLDPDKTNLNRFKRCIFKSVGSYIPCSVCANSSQGTFDGRVWFTQKTCKQLTNRHAMASIQKHKKRIGKRQLRLASYSNRNLTVHTIRDKLNYWRRTKNFMPNVIAVDYPDIMLPDNTRIEFRHQQNQIWMDLRALAEDYDALVIAPTQVSSKSYGKYLLSDKDFSEDKRKYAHVTGMITINQTPEERRLGIVRYGKLFSRNTLVDTKYAVRASQCLQIARPLVFSF